MPRMFITRVRLCASTLSAISVATLGNRFIRKCVVPIRNQRLVATQPEWVDCGIEWIKAFDEVDCYLGSTIIYAALRCNNKAPFRSPKPPGRPCRRRFSARSRASIPTRHPKAHANARAIPTFRTTNVTSTIPAVAPVQLSDPPSGSWPTAGK
jgi:hypothetical protein